MTGLNSPTPTSLPAPKLGSEGEKGVPFTFDFSQSTSYNVDLTQQQQAGFFSALKSCFVDNSLNSSPVELLTGGMGEPLIIPPNAQAYLPIMATNPPNLIASSAGGVIVKVILFNFAVPACVWLTSSATSTTPLPVTEENVTLTDASVATPATGSSTQLLAANANRRYVIIYVGDDTWLNFSGGSAAVDGAGSFKLAAGQFYETNSLAFTNQINYFQAANTKPITCQYG